MLRRHRTSTSITALAIVAALAVVPATAQAATAPTLVEPAANAGSLTEGGSVTFSWKGDLQGDADALDRSFFRVEVMAASSVPAGAQAEWPESKIENFAQTEPGTAATSVTLGVPNAGEYRWRVCAWGVADVMAANQIQQLTGGCSASRAMTTVAAASTSKQIGAITMEERRQVAGEVTTVYVPREDTTPAEPAPQVEEPAPTPQVEPEPVEPTSYQAVDTDGRGDSSALSLGGGDGGLDADAAASRSGVAGSVRNILGGELPLVQIPFWTLLLLVACFPILVLWRRSVLGMFEWEDGSIDGAGTMPDPLGELALVPVASDIKDRSTVADGAVPAPAPSDLHHDAPDGRRRAA